MQPTIRLAIHQPNLLPRLKVLQKLAQADVWCVLDSVQYNAGEWQNRSRIVTFHGNNETFWLTIPVHRPYGRSTLIREITVAKPSIVDQRIKQTLFYAFRRAPYWNAIDEFLSNLKPVLTANNLVQFCVETTCFLLHIAGRQPTVLFSSSLPIIGKGSTLMAAICRHLNAASYLADSGAKNYLQSAHFTGIEVVWQDWCEPLEKWPGIKSWRDISNINYLARVGPERFKQHLLNCKFISNPACCYPVSNSEFGNG